MEIRRVAHLGLRAALTLASLSGAAPASAQITELSGGEVVRPFAIGERLTYAVRVGPFGRGSAVAELRALDTLRGRPVFHSVFTIGGSLLFFKVDDVYESWFDPATLVSL